MFKTFRAPAKINLTLDVLGRDANGYHRIQTITHEVPELYDELTFEGLNEAVIELTTDHSSLACDATNTVHRAASLLQKKYALQKGVRIHLSKKIPLASGLGGGSSDAATTLKALNELWQLNLSREQLLTHAAEIGMDVPFFIMGGCALGMHYGEQLMPLPTLQTVPGYEKARIEIIPTGIEVSTKEAYAAIDLSESGKAEHETSQLVNILKGEKTGNIEPLFHNDFEAVFLKNHSQFATKYIHSHLTGTGGARWRLVK